METYELSNCCNAPITGYDICSQCNEHCISVEEQDRQDEIQESNLPLEDKLSKLMGNPMEQIDGLVSEATELTKKYPK